MVCDRIRGWLSGVSVTRARFKSILNGLSDFCFLIRAGRFRLLR